MRFLSGLTAVFLVFAASVAAQEIDYAGARKKVKLTGQPLLIFVNTPVRTVNGFVSVHVETLPGYPAKCIVVGDSKLDWLATFAHVAADSDLREAVAPKAVPFGSGPASNAGRDGKPFSAVAEMIHAANRTRSANGRSILTEDAGLNNAAQSWANVMAHASKLYHSRMSYGEIIGWNHSSGTEVVGGWMRSPSHRRDLLGNYTKIGGGMAMSRNGEPYWILLFD